LIPVFGRALAGAPLRAVYIGGSITQDGNGWALDWLTKQFPRSSVVAMNAGMSATGSELGIFRLERDVIACQPDLVFVEFAVNDGGQPDEQAIRCLESIVVRLKSLPHAPAVVFLETAAKDGSRRTRHQAVARHYGLLDIDFQVALDAYLAKEKLPWNALVKDNVHPNAQGHAFYSEVIAKALAPYVARAKKTPPAPVQGARLPALMSKRQLWLDAQLAAIPTNATWRREHSLPFWWNMFFMGVTSCDTPGATLTIPFRGTAVGLFYALDPGYGTCYASVDGGSPQVIVCNNRGGYTYAMLATDLKAQQHLLTLAIPQAGAGAKPRGVKLGFLLVAGGNKASDTLATQGVYTPTRLAEFTVALVAAHCWQVIGPFGGSQPTLESTKDLDTSYPPEQKVELGKTYAGNQGKTVAWKRLTGDDALVNFGTLYGLTDRGVSYAYTRIWMERAQTLRLQFAVDYFAKIWLNGNLIKTLRDGHGGPSDPVIFPVSFAAGWNEVLVKVHAGSLGNTFSLALEQPVGELRWMP
jgi:lysophospholipase L1-like esterase